MQSITQALVFEHAVFRKVFEQIEHVLPQAGSTGEVQVLSAVVEGLLQGHGKTEADLAYSALDHALEEDGRLNQLHQDHHEIDEHFKRVHRASDLSQARQLFTKALAATRRHFRHEEEIVFPFLERVLQPRTLEAFGQAWRVSHDALKSPLPPAAA